MTVTKTSFAQHQESTVYLSAPQRERRASVLSLAWCSPPEGGSSQTLCAPSPGPTALWGPALAARAPSTCPSSPEWDTPSRHRRVGRPSAAETPPVCTHGSGGQCGFLRSKIQAIKDTHIFRIITPMNDDDDDGCFYSVLMWGWEDLAGARHQQTCFEWCCPFPGLCQWEKLRWGGPGLWLPENRPQPTAGPELWQYLTDGNTDPFLNII